MGLIKSVWKGYRGGPDLKQVTLVSSLLDDIQLSVTLPVTCTHIMADYPPRPVNFPFRQASWFEKNVKQVNQHHFVTINVETWYYYPLFGAALTGELGLFSVRTMLKRIDPDHAMNAWNLDALGSYVTEEYDRHFNSPVIGGHGDWGLGANTEIRQDVEEQSKRLSSPFTTEEFAREYELRTASNGFPPIHPHRILSILGRDWIFYREGSEIRSMERNYYCYPISSEYYLCFYFQYRKDTDKFKRWKADAEAAERHIMERVKIQFPEGGDQAFLPSK